MGNRVEFPGKPSFVSIGEQPDFRKAGSKKDTRNISFIGDRKSKKPFSDPGSLSDDDWNTIGMIAESLGASIARREWRRRRDRGNGNSNIIDISIVAKLRGASVED